MLRPASMAKIWPEPSSGMRSLRLLNRAEKLQLLSDLRREHYERSPSSIGQHKKGASGNRSTKVGWRSRPYVNLKREPGS